MFTGGGNFDPDEIRKLLGQALVADHPIPQNPTAFARLKAAIEKPRQPPSPGAARQLPELAKSVSGKTYTFGQNVLGLRSISLQFTSGENASITLAFADGRTERHAVGNDIAKISTNGQYGLPVAARGRWESPNVFVVDYDTIANVNRYTLKMVFEGNGLQLQAQESGSHTPMSMEGTQLQP